jgi:hypothetical protein
MVGLIRKKTGTEAWETVEDTGGGGSVSSVTTPDVGSGNSDPITVKTGDAPAGDAGDILVQGGAGDLSGGVGASIVLQPGAGDTNGTLAVDYANGDVAVQVAGQLQLFGLGADPGQWGVQLDGGTTIINEDPAQALGFFGDSGASRQTITGALSTVADAAAKDVLTAIVTALNAYGFAIDGTT